MGHDGNQGRIGRGRLTPAAADPPPLRFGRRLSFVVRRDIR
ncbi:TPA: hypothetical protein ENG04_02215 [Candidatus Poribacteria bacterium]|nr:hypothetical protein [Candidatus Poribacteria bacterium]HEX28878.1 hypothetical protein [Candidatus Poribacteria bacterium]